MNRERLLLTISAGLGVLATFLPWIHFPLVGALIGTQLGWFGWTSFACFGTAVIIVLATGPQAPLDRTVRIATTVPAALALAIIGWKAVEFTAAINSGNDNEFAKTLAATTGLGIGAYLAMASGIATVILSWVPIDRLRGTSPPVEEYRSSRTPVVVAREPGVQPNVPMSHGTKRALIVVVGLAAIGGLSVVAFSIYQGSPRYAVRQIKAAVRDHDTALFDKHVDVEAIVSSFEADVPSNHPTLVLPKMFTVTLSAAIRRGIEDGAFRADSEVAKGMVKFLTSPDARVDEQGKSAFFIVPVRISSGEPFDIRFHMGQSGAGVWKVDRITNVNELATAELKADLARKAEEKKATVEKLKKKAADIDEQLKKLVVVAGLHTPMNDEWPKKSRFQLKLRNDLGKAITSFDGELLVPKQGYKHAATAREMPIAAGGTANLTWEFPVETAVPASTSLFAAGELDTVQLRVDAVTFADGTSLHRLKVDDRSAD